MSDPLPGDQGVAELGRVVGDVEVAGDLYDAGADGVDADLAVRELYGELAGEGVDGVWLGKPANPWTEVTFTMLPPPLMKVTALRARKK